MHCVTETGWLEFRKSKSRVLPSSSVARAPTPYWISKRRTLVNDDNDESVNMMKLMTIIMIMMIWKPNTTSIIRIIRRKTRPIIAYAASPSYLLSSLLDKIGDRRGDEDDDICR